MQRYRNHSSGFLVGCIRRLRLSFINLDNVTLVYISLMELYFFDHIDTNIIAITLLNKVT